MKKKRLLMGLVAMAAVTGVASLTACTKTDKPADVETQNYEITFETNGGGTVAAKTTADGKITAPTAPTKDGYTFAGWFDNAALTGTAVDFSTKTFTANTKLYAKWTQNAATSHVITMVLNNGSPNTTQTVNKDADGFFTPQVPTAPTREYYTFDKWYSDEECTTEFDWTASLSADTTIYAGWNTINETVITSVTGNDITKTTTKYKRFEFTAIDSIEQKSGNIYDGATTTKDNVATATPIDTLETTGVIKNASADINVTFAAPGKFTIVIASGGSASKFDLFGEDKVLIGKGDNSDYGKMYMRHTVEVAKAGTYTITFSGTVRIASMTIEESLPTGPITEIDASANSVVMLLGRDYAGADSALIDLKYGNGRVDSLAASDCTIDASAVDKTTAGVYTVTVSYTKNSQTYTDTYTVEYLAPSSIGYFSHIQTSDKVMDSLQTVYAVSSKAAVDYKNMTVVFYATDSTGKTHSFVAETGEYDITAIDLTTAGVKTATVTTSLNASLEGVTLKVIGVADTEQTSVTVNPSLTTEYEVAADGKLSFKTITYAYQYLALLDDEVEKTLLINEGTYAEKLYFNIPNLTVTGTGSDASKVVITEGYYNQMTDVLGHSYSTRGSATVFVTEKAVNFHMENLTVGNDQNTTEEYWALRAEGISGTQGVALYTAAKNGTYVNCRFTGYHDTLEVDYNNNYFEKCYIEGRTDFIFGYTANAYFYDCEIHTLKSNKSATDTTISEEGGYIIATQPTDNSTAFVFNDCEFTADEEVIDGSVTIGRSWGSSTTVIIMNSELGGHITKTAFTGAEISLTRYVSMSGNVPGVSSKLVEYNNTGDGAISASQTYTKDSETRTTVLVPTTEAEIADMANYSDLGKFYTGFVFENSLQDTYEVTYEGVYTGTVSTIAAVNEYLASLTQYQFSNVFTLPAFEVGGLKLDGVYTDAACTNALTAVDGVYTYTLTDTATTTVGAEKAGLYVKFKDDAATVTYNTNGGTLVVDGQTTTDTTVDYSKGDAEIVLATAELEGKSFAYWTTEAPTEGAYATAPTEFTVPTTGLTENITLYAYYINQVTTHYGFTNPTVVPTSDTVFTIDDTKGKFSIVTSALSYNSVSYTSYLKSSGKTEMGSSGTGHFISFTVPAGATAVLKIVAVSGGTSARCMYVDTAFGNSATPVQTYGYIQFAANDGYVGRDLTTTTLQPGTYYINYSNGVRFYSIDLAITK